jgi:hypothetical protein
MSRWLCLFFVLASCVPSAEVAQPTPKSDAATARVGFSHESHYQRKAGLDCTDCHSYSAKNADFGRPAHEACSSCHTAEFTTGASANFCESCHAPQSKSLQGFPREGKGSISLASFNHKSHLSPSEASLSKFGQSTCETCHNPNDSVEGSLVPGHKECSGCHGDSAGKNAAAPKLISQATGRDCLGCHTDVRK